MCLRGFPGANTVRWLASADPGGAFLRVLHDAHGRLPLHPLVASKTSPAPLLAALGSPLEETVRGARWIAGWYGLLAFPRDTAPAPALDG